MIRLILSDLRLHARVWAGVFAVALVAGVVLAFGAGLSETAAQYSGDVRRFIESTASMVKIFGALTALIVLASTAGLTVSLQRRGYALWGLVGVRSPLVGAVVLGQLAVVGLAAGLLGALLATPCFAPGFRWAFRDVVELDGAVPRLGVQSIVGVAICVAAVAAFGGLRGALAAARTAPIEALRAGEDGRERRFGWLRWVLAAGVALALGLLVRALLQGSFEDASSMGPLATPLVAALMVALGPVLYSPVMRAWTAVIPARISATWYLARHGAVHRLGRSSAAISPLFVAVSLAGGLYTARATLAAAQFARTGEAGGYALQIEGVVLLLGGPLLLAAVAAAATIFMSGHARERELALIQSAGSTRAAVLLAAAWEAVIYSATATLLGAAASAIGGWVIALAVGLSAPVVDFAAIGIIGGCGFVLVLAATVIPTAAGSGLGLARVLAAE